MTTRVAVQLVVEVRRPWRRPACGFAERRVMLARHVMTTDPILEHAPVDADSAAALRAIAVAIFDSIDARA